MVTRAEWYKRVNEVWAGIAVPPLTMHEADRAVRKMLRSEGAPAPRKIVETSGRRYTWQRGDALSINPSKGWSDLVHMVSHVLHLRTKLPPHHPSHARLEIRLRKMALARGWLDGSLRPAPTVSRAKPSKAEQLAKAAAHAAAMLRRAETRLKLATTLAKKWRRRAASAERRLATEVQS